MVSNDIVFATTDSTDYTPPVVTFATSTDITNIANTTATISWTTNEPASSKVEYSTDTSYASSSISNNLNSGHKHVLNGLVKSTLYHFRLINTDASGNTATSTDYTFSTINTDDYTPPVITFATSTGITNITDTTATISWTTNELATSTLSYGLNTSYGATLSNNNLNINHTYELTGLTKGTQYHIQLGDTDASGNTMVSNDIVFATTDSTDYTLPVISSVSSSPVLDTIAIINWNTNRLTTSTLEYGVDQLNLDSSILDNNFNKTHAIAISSLLPSTKYYYKIKATDSNRVATSSEGFFTTSEPLIGEAAVQQKVALAKAAGAASGGGGGVLIINKVDRIPPLITKVVVSNITNRSATVSWLTNENADGYVQFGISSSYGAVSGQRTRVMNHKTILNNLQSGTQYHYNVSSVDASGNYSETSDKTFSTLSLKQELTVSPKNKISASSSSNIISTQISRAQNFFNLANQAIQKMVGVIRSSVSRVSLNLISSSLNNQQNSIDELAKLLPVPIMSGSPLVVTTDRSATIGWKTDKNSNSLVAFSPANLYNSSDPSPYIQVVGNSTEVVTSHSVTIRGLSPDTLYHYQLRSKPSVGAAAISNDFTFKTKSESLGIQKYDITKVTPNSASFRWVTNANTSATVSYTPYKNNKLDPTHTEKKFDKTLATIHNIVLNNLTPGVAYRVVLSSEDASNAVVKQVIDHFFTNKVGVAPNINQVQTISAISPGKNLRIQTVISWRTNEPSTSRVYYKKGVAKSGDVLSQSTSLDDNYTTKHIVVITTFEPGSIYSFRTKSIDYNGKTSFSKIYTILTPQQEDSVFQVIAKNFAGMFGWVRQINK